MRSPYQDIVTERLRREAEERRRERERSQKQQGSFPSAPSDSFTGSIGGNKPSGPSSGGFSFGGGGSEAIGADAGGSYFGPSFGPSFGGPQPTQFGGFGAEGIGADAGGSYFGSFGGGQGGPISFGGGGAEAVGADAGGSLAGGSGGGMSSIGGGGAGAALLWAYLIKMGVDLRHQRLKENPDDGLGNFGLAMMGPSSTQMAKDPIGTGLPGIFAPWLTPFTASDEAKQEAPLWTQLGF